MISDKDVMDLILLCAAFTPIFTWLAIDKWRHK